MHRRTGKPLAHPLTTRLTHAETAEFKQMCRRRDLSVNRVLGSLARAEMKTWRDVHARSETKTDQSANFHQFGLTPRRETVSPFESPRVREADLNQRRADQATSPTVILDKPGNVR